MKRKPGVTVRQPPRDSSRYRGPNTKHVCLGDVVLAVIQEQGAGRWFWYGMAGPRATTSSRPDHFDAVKAEAVAACRKWVKDQASGCGARARTSQPDTGGEA